MQYVIIVLIVGVAVAAVMVPLLRGTGRARSAAGDLDPITPGGGGMETRQEPSRPGTTDPEQRPLVGAPSGPHTAPTTPAPAAPEPPGETATEELPQAAPPPPVPPRPLGAAAGDSRTEQEVLQYREALRARTICAECSSANPPGSKYCKHCGEPLAANAPA